jgi:hypothetical protein
MAAVTSSPTSGRGESPVGFELERLERVGERLELSGRWFGVRGRRFFRPTLTVAHGGERVRALADLEHKPWAAEEGEAWTAAFPWRDDPPWVGGAQAQLSVAPDIAVALPDKLPAGRRTPERLRPLAADQIVDGGPWRAGAGAAEAPKRRRPSELEKTREQLRTAEQALDTAREELGGLREELEASRSSAQATDSVVRAARDEVVGTRAELAEAETALTARDREMAELRRLLAAAERERDEALAGRDAITAERERADAERDAVSAERDAVAAERDAVAARAQEAPAPPPGDRPAPQQAPAAALTAPLTPPPQEPSPARGLSPITRGSLPHRRNWPQRTFALGLLVAALIALGLILHVL